MVKRVSVLALVAIMLFSFVMFGASNCEMYDPRLMEMQRKIEEMERRIREQEERIKELERELEELEEEKNAVLALQLHRSMASLELREYVDTFDQYNYFLEDWIELLSHLADGLQVILTAEDKLQIDEALAAAKAAIDGVLIRRSVVYSDCGWFRLTMSVNKNRVNIGDYVEISASLKNLSGMDLPVLFADGVRVYNETNRNSSHPPIEPSANEIEHIILSSVSWAEGIPLISIGVPRTGVVLEKDSEINVVRSRQIRGTSWRFAVTEIRFFHANGAAWSYNELWGERYFECCRHNYDEPLRYHISIDSHIAMAVI